MIGGVGGGGGWGESGGGGSCRRSTAQDNKAALDAKLAECKNNPGQLKDTPNCQNARAAFEVIFKSGTFERVKEPEYGF